MTPTHIPAALALLREKGWCQGSLRDEHNRFCLLAAAERVGLLEEDYRAIDRVIWEQHCRWWTIQRFNDDPSTTFEIVEALLEKATLERGGAL